MSGGKCPTREGEMSRGELSGRGNVRGEVSRGKCPTLDATSGHPTCHLLFALFKTTTNTITYSIYVDSTRLNYIRFGAELTRGRLHWVTGRVVWEPSSFWDRVDLGPSCPGAELTWGRFGLGTK